MNCQEFESRLDVLARGALADARDLGAAARHEKACAACAARLADERALSTGLRALASGMKGVEAPAGAETALLAAFRARAAASSAGSDKDLSRATTATATTTNMTATTTNTTATATNTAATGNVVPLTSRAASRRWSWVKTAAAASMAAAASVALFALVRPGAQVDAPRAAAPQAAMIEPPPGAIGGQRGSRPSEVAASVTAGAAAGVEQSTAPAHFETDDRPTRATSAPRARALNASHVAGRGRTSPVRPAAAAAAQEVATDFIPLVQGAQYAHAEESQLVRVELPRTALASFGLPVDDAGAAGRVKADVLLGEDGVARAIRFVR